MGLRRLFTYTIICIGLQANTSCFSYRPVTFEEIQQNSCKKMEKAHDEVLILKTQKTKYRVHDYKWESDHLEGKLVPYRYQEGTFIYLTTKQDIFTPSNFHENSMLTLPYDEIDSYVIKEVSALNTYNAIWTITAIVVVTAVVLTGGAEVHR